MLNEQLKPPPRAPVWRVTHLSPACSPPPCPLSVPSATFTTFHVARPIRVHSCPLVVSVPASDQNQYISDNPLGGVVPVRLPRSIGGRKLRKQRIQKDLPNHAVLAASRKGIQNQIKTRSKPYQTPRGGWGAPPTPTLTLTLTPTPAPWSARLLRVSPIQTAFSVTVLAQFLAQFWHSFLENDVKDCLSTN
jgi:hypothetical protein